MIILMAVTAVIAVVLFFTATFGGNVYISRYAATARKPTRSLGVALFPFLLVLPVLIGMAVVTLVSPASSIFQLHLPTILSTANIVYIVALGGWWAWLFRIRREKRTPAKQAVNDPSYPSIVSQ